MDTIIGFAVKSLIMTAAAGVGYDLYRYYKNAGENGENGENQAILSPLTKQAALLSASALGGVVAINLSKRLVGIE